MAVSDFAKKYLAVSERIQDFGFRIVQGTARSYAGTAEGLQRIGAGLVRRTTGRNLPIQTLTPTGRWQEKFYGTNKPITARSSGEELPFVKKGSKIAPTLGVLVGALDLVPSGKSGVSLMKGLQTADNVRDVSKLLRASTKFGDDVIQNIAPAVAKTTDAQAIRSILNSAQRGIAKAPFDTAEKGFRSVTEQVGEFIKKNPDSSVVGKKFRDSVTKEHVGGPRLFQRIGDAIETGELSTTEIPNIIKQYGLNAEEAGTLFRRVSTSAGRTLHALSKLEKEIRSLLPDVVLQTAPPTAWQQLKSWYLAVDNTRRSLLVTQLATAMRNLWSQSGRYAIGTFDDAVSGAIGAMRGDKKAAPAVFEDFAALLRRVSPTGRAELRALMQNHPLDAARLFNTPVGDVALSGKIANFFNTVNRAQEYMFRNLILDAKLHTAAKLQGVPIEKLGVDDVAHAVDEALDWTFAKAPKKNGLGAAILRAYDAIPMFTLVNPFPRFLTNSIRFMYQHSPAGLMSLFTKETRAAIAAGDNAVIAKAITGTIMLGAGLATRASEFAGDKWYEVKVGDNTYDLRPFAPFSTYLLFGELMLNGTKNVSGSDIALALTGLSRIQGTGLMLIELISDEADKEKILETLDAFVSNYVSGFTVPLVTLKDILGQFREESRVIRDSREIPVLGGALANVPIASEMLPAKYSLFEDKPLQRESPLLRQLTGLSVSNKSFIEREFSRLGYKINYIIPKTGNRAANRIITKQTGVLLDSLNDTLEYSEKFQRLSDAEKLEILKGLVSTAKSEAKGQVAAQLAQIVYDELQSVDGKEERAKVVEQLYNRGLLTKNIQEYLRLIKASNSK